MKNFMTLEGNLGGKPQTVSTDKATFLVLSVAQNYQSKDKEPKTEWFEINIFEKSLMERCKSLASGDLVQITGRFHTINKKIETKTIPVVKLVGTQVQKITRLKKLPASDFPEFESFDEVTL